jgi:hypothetical protein
VGFQHISSGRFLQARRKGLHKLVFFASNFGVNEQFEAREIHESNSSARWGWGCVQVESSWNIMSEQDVRRRSSRRRCRKPRQPFRPIALERRLVW